MKNKPTILIIDDSPSNLQLLAHVLKDQYFIKVANHGHKGLEVAHSLPRPDLILLDIIMPDIDGYEVCKQLKADDKVKDIPIIFITGKTDTDDEEKGLLIGASDYITKPIKPAIVLARVKNQITIRRQHLQLQEIAMHDALTGLYNRHYLLDQFSKRLSHAARHGNELSLLVIDIDHFKQVNDTHGHKAGDNILKAVATILEKNCRKEDIAVRFGGEEFVVLLEHCNLDSAQRIAEKMRAEIELAQPEGIKITASFGLSELSETSNSFDSLFNRADEAMYAAKEAGRNKVVVAH